MERERVLSIRDLEISFDTVHGKAAAIGECVLTCIEGKR